MVEWERLRHIVEEEFADIVESTKIIRDKLRVLLYDSSYLDFWWSTKIKGRFAHHWERTHIDKTIYRHDNMPTLNGKKYQLFLNISTTAVRKKLSKAFFLPTLKKR